MESTARIVVGVDRSPSSRQALRWGAALAEATGAELEAVTAWEPDPTVWGGEGWALTAECRDCSKDAEETLETAIRSALGEAGITVRRRTVEGSAARALIEASEGALMLVVGSRGYGSLKSLLLGSVSVPCAERAHCPVLVVHGTHTPPTFHPSPADERVLVG